MFSGIIDHCGTIASLESRKDSLHILIECQFTDMQAGESIAVDGICLTVINPNPKQFYCDISSETLNLTTAKNFKVGCKVNIERAMRMGDRIGGHMVSGHVDQTAIVKDIQRTQDFIKMMIGNVTKENMSYLVKKGSIAVNGVSLTLNQILSDGFELMLIPHTLEITDLKYLTLGDEVNLEFDGIVKTIVQTVNESLKHAH